jgi:hypothetical protein
MLIFWNPNSNYPYSYFKKNRAVLSALHAALLDYLQIISKKEPLADLSL